MSRAHIKAVALSAMLLLPFAVTAEDTPYTVTHGHELDAQSYQGFNWCSRCHGTYAQAWSDPTRLRA